MRKTLAMLALTAVSVACGQAIPTGPEVAKVEHGEICPTQTMGCFDFTGELTTERVTPVKVEGVSQDLPTPGYRNRWRYVLSAPAGDLLAKFQDPTPGNTHTIAVIFASTGRGGMVAEVWSLDGKTLYWHLSLRPTSDVIASKFAELVGSEETTPQTFQVKLLEDGGAEIVISEPEAKRP